MADELYLKNRLALDDRYLKPLEKKFLSFMKSLPNDDIQTAQHTFENLMIQLLSYQTHLERHPSIQQANLKDIDEYKDIIEKTQAIQLSARKDIMSLKEELKRAQKIRDHKLEYDRVAREIMKLETRDTYNESIASLQSDIDLLNREKLNKLAAIENRKHNLSRLVQDLKFVQKSVEAERAITTDDQARFMEMERGYVSSDDEGDMGGLSDDEPEKEEEKAAPANHRFQERNDEEDEEEGIVTDAAPASAPMVE